jgi:hypothetical protein
MIIGCTEEKQNKLKDINNDDDNNDDDGWMIISSIFQ